jgi:hypothetical protein
MIATLADRLRYPREGQEGKGDCPAGETAHEPRTVLPFGGRDAGVKTQEDYDAGSCEQGADEEERPLEALLSEQTIKAAADEPPKGQAEERIDESIPRVAQQGLRMPGGRPGSREGNEDVEGDAGKIDRLHERGSRDSRLADGPGHDLAAREGHVKLAGVDADLTAARGCLVEVNGHQSDRDEDEHDQEGQIDDQQKVRKGDAISAHGWKVSGVGQGLQLKSVEGAGATMAPYALDCLQRYLP